MPLDAVECLRRLLLHVLPRGFQHIRHYGFLANRGREEQLTRCRQLLQPSATAAPVGIPIISDAGGTGLGLVIAKAIIEKHQGSISVASVPGEGTQFRVLLPVLGRR